MSAGVFLNLVYVVFGLAFVVWAILQIFNVAYEVQQAQVAEAEASALGSQSRPTLKRTASSSQSSRPSMSSLRARDVSDESSKAVELTSLPDHAAVEITPGGSQSASLTRSSDAVVNEPLSASEPEPALTTSPTTSVPTETVLSVEDTLEAVLAGKASHVTRDSPNVPAVKEPVEAPLWREVQSKDGTMYAPCVDFLLCALQRC